MDTMCTHTLYPQICGLNWLNTNAADGADRQAFKHWGLLGGKTNQQSLQFSVGDSWDVVFPPMLTKRINPVVVNITTYLIVAGGKESAQPATIEILNIKTRQWYTAGSLHRSVTQK